MSGFIDYIQEMFEPFGQVEARKMFGGYGLYHQGVMFAIVVDDTLYLKTDGTTAKDFIARGLGQFEYNRGGRIVKMSYYLAPPEILEDSEAASLWAGRAYDVAFRASSSK